ncbi:BTB domain-containing protein [Caenorhabditis elegans]|uniref:BTB domain-containing protein n=1 Tax=Caenorhabditis elegans TaxID=6239 RepID=D9N132_CAEEL|nr:BTB domain-containing protein [Caenorhabditis elegans]CBO22679.1 BTB domain-containing protein [Caenorhabditis elegans]|eukprot:NP_001256235.1 Uncharacterized protein CELE_C32C4.1 [Caenorhabditis elegans]
MHARSRRSARRQNSFRQIRKIVQFGRLQAEENAAVQAASMERRVAFRPPPIGESRSTTITHDSGSNADTYMRLNVGGKSYYVRAELYTSEWTRMHELLDSSHEERLKMVDGFDSKTGEYYLERNAKLTDHVMDFFVTGSLHKPQNVCVERFKEELEYWKIKPDQLSTCCQIPSEHHVRKLSRGTSFNEDDYVTDFDGACFAGPRLAMWKFLEDPQSSVFAAVFALLSVFFVFASVVGLILGSMPEFQADSSNAATYHVMHVRSRPNDYGNKFGNDDDVAPNELLKDFVYKPTDSPNLPLTILEYICIGWFTFEYLVRFTIYPRKRQFVKKTLNIIDLSTILPFYLEICLPLFGVESRLKEFTGAMLVVRVLRVLRMARVFKLARYSTSLQTFGHTLQSSITELSMLSMFLITGIVFFSTIMYYLEKDEPHTDFYSIPAGCWWCVVTMATVGYGDAKPVTTLGKLVATSTSICGIIVLAFPISMIVEKFATAQQRAIEDQQIQQAQMSAVANNALLRRFPTRRKVRRNTTVSVNNI